MAEVVYLAAYRRRHRERSGRSESAQHTHNDDTLLIRRLPDGTYAAELSGAYARSHLLAAEHASDLASTLVRKIRLP